MAAPRIKYALRKKTSTSYSVFKSALSASDINDDDEVVMIVGMKVLPDYIKEFEAALKAILRAAHKVPGHLSSCVVRPRPGRTKYTTIIKYANREAADSLHDAITDSGVDFYKLLATRDSYLSEPPTYQMESGFGTWVDFNGETKPLKENDTVDKSLISLSDSCDDPKGLNVTASFVTATRESSLFQQKYQRNNKKGGQKNLRCFPGCRNGIHVNSGFCGDSIKVHVVISRKTSTGGVKVCPYKRSSPNLVAFCRFIPLQGSLDATVVGPSVSPGQAIDVQNIEDFVRTRNKPLLPFVPGLFKGSSTTGETSSSIFEFNSDCKAWHYGWSAPRGQGQSGGDIQHVLEVLFFKPLESSLHCLEILRSDSFTVYSSRRANNHSESNRAEKRLRVSPKAELQSYTMNINQAVQPNGGVYYPPRMPFDRTENSTTSVVPPTYNPPAYNQIPSVDPPSVVGVEEIPWSDLYAMFDESVTPDSTVPAPPYCVLPMKRHSVEY